jgi:hypothetical protein
MNESETRTDKRPADESLVGVPRHPVAMAGGALLAGAATGAVVGTAAGPVGALIGAAVGAVAGGLGGDAIANSVEQVRDAHDWQDRYAKRPYVLEGESWEDFGPAFAYGFSWRQRRAGVSFDDLEPELAAGWETERGASRLGWDRARHAVRDAWDDNTS